MKKSLSFVFVALVVSMVIGAPTAFADIKLDSLVNIAIQARSQVKIQLDNSPGATDEIRSLYEQGNNETNLLISAAKEGNVNEAKLHFLSAMKIFKQVSMALSEPQQAATLQKAQVNPAVLINYKNDINRTEKYVGMLKDLVVKSGFTVDFSKVDGLIQNARSSLAENDIQSIERIIGELKSALTEVQNAIREQTIQQQNERARAFANSYVTKIDAMLAQANQLGLSEDDIAKLLKAKEDIASTNDPSQIIIKVKRYSINFSLAENTSKQEAASKQAEVQEEQKPNPPQEREQKETTKNQKLSTEISRFEARLADIEPHVDENIKSKFERALPLLSKLKNQETTSNADYLRTVRMLDLLLDQMEQYIQSPQDSGDNTTTDQGKDQQKNQDKSEKKRSSNKDQ